MDLLDQYVKEHEAAKKTDLDAYIAEHEAPSGPKTSAGRAFAGSASNAATLGYLPEIEAAIEPAAFKILDFINGTDVSNILPPKSFAERRDQSAAALKQAADEHPMASGAGTAAGLITSAAGAGGLAAAKGATMGARALQAGKVGGLLGLLENVEQEEGAYDPVQLGKRVSNAAKGAALGAGTTGGLEGLAALLSKTAAPLSKKAAQKAVSAIGARKAHVKQLGPERAEALGREALDEGIVTALTTPGRVLSKIEGKSAATRQELDKIVKETAETLGDPNYLASLTSEQAGKLSRTSFKPKATAAKLAQEIKSEASEVGESEILPGLKKLRELGQKYRYADADEAKDAAAAWLDTKRGKDFIKQFGSDVVEDDIDHLADRLAKQFFKTGKAQEFADTFKMKRQLDEVLGKKAFYMENPSSKVDAMLRFRKAVKESTEQQADYLAELLGEQGGKLKSTNRKMSSLISIENIANDRAAAEATNRAIGLTDTIASSGGAATGAAIGAASGIPGAATLGGAAGGVIGGGINKLGRTFGAGLQATGYNTAAKAAARSPELAREVVSDPAQLNLLLSRLGADPTAFTPMSDQPILNNPQLMELFRQKPDLINNIEDEKLRAQVLQKVGRTPSSDRAKRLRALER